MGANSNDYPQVPLAEWQAAAAKSAPAGQVDALNWTTPENIAVKPLYIAADLKGLPGTSSVSTSRTFRQSTSERRSGLSLSNCRCSSSWWHSPPSVSGYCPCRSSRRDYFPFQAKCRSFSRSRTSMTP